MIAFSLIRLIALSVVLLFSLVVLALSAFMASVSNSEVHTVFDFNALGIADAVITFAIVIPAILIGRMRRGAIFTTLMVEVGWVSFLCIMWLAEAARSADGMPSLAGCEFVFLAFAFASGIANDGIPGIPGDFGGVSDVSIPTPSDPFAGIPDGLVDEGKIKAVCQSWPAITALSFLNWIILLGYLITLITLGVRGNHWRTDVSDVTYGPATTNTFNNTGVGNNKMQMSPGQEKQNYGYPPQQQMPQQQMPQQQMPQQQYPQQQVPQHTGEYSPYGAGTPAPAHMQQQQV